MVCCFRIFLPLFAPSSATAFDVLDPEIDQFANDVYNFVSYSTKRKSEFSEGHILVICARNSILCQFKTCCLGME